MAEALGVPHDKLLALARYVPDSKRFRTFEIPKSNGLRRKISEPIPPLKSLQRILASEFANHFYRPPIVVHGFVREKSIKTNALPHLDRPWLVNVDLENFFPSITVRRVCGLLKKWKTRDEESGAEWSLSPSVASLISNLCCFRGVPADEGDGPAGLPQGSPASPILSNMIAIGMDRELLGFARRRGFVYTRYADDVSFSPTPKAKPNGFRALVETSGSEKKERPSGVRPELEDVFHRHGFRVRHEKTRLFVRPGRREVTGLVVNEIVNVPRREVKRLRSLLYLWESRDYERAASIHGSYKGNRHSGRPKELSMVVMGKLLFLSMVRGKGDFAYLRLRRKFLSLCERDRPKTEHRGMEAVLKVDPDDFPLRSSFHLGKLRKQFDRSYPDLKAMRKTQLGSWAHERLHSFPDSDGVSDFFSRDHSCGGGTPLQALAMKAEACVVLHAHEELFADAVYDGFHKFLNRLYSLNGAYCGSLFAERSFRNTVKKIDFSKAFDRINDEFCTQIRGTRRFTSEFLLSNLGSVAKDKVDENAAGWAKQPFNSLLAWIALYVLAEAENDEMLIAHRENFTRVFDSWPTFGKDYHKISDCRNRIKNGDPPNLSPADFRLGALKVWRAFGGVGFRVADPD